MSFTMKTQESSSCETALARPLAPEDLRCGDFVGILLEVAELPSWCWGCESHVLNPHEPVRITYRSDNGGTPLKVKAVCLPFVFVKLPSGQHRTLDIRQHELVRLDGRYARIVWKTLSKQASSRVGAVA
jgi:hypothetical protein